MVPLAWYRLLKQAGYPDLVASTGAAPGGGPLPEGGEVRGIVGGGGHGPPPPPPPPPHI